MNEDQINREPGFQENQLLDNPLADTQYQSGNSQAQDLENRDTNIGSDFPERTHQHDYKNPSAGQFEDNEEDETDTDEEDVDTDNSIFNEEGETNTDPVEEQSPDVRNQDQL